MPSVQGAFQEALYLQRGGVHDALVVLEGERDGVLSHSCLTRRCMRRHEHRLPPFLRDIS